MKKKLNGSLSGYEFMVKLIFEKNIMNSVLFYLRDFQSRKQMNFIFH